MAEDSAPPVEQMALASLNDGVATSFSKAEFSDRVLIRTILSRADGGAGLAGQNVKVGGWVKTGREQGKGSFAFLELNDGSCPANLQVIVDADVAPLGQIVQTGTCVHVEGLLKVPPEGTKQRVELRVEKVHHVGPVDPVKYPLPKTRLTLEFLRDIVHFRPRTNTVLSLFMFLLICLVIVIFFRIVFQFLPRNGSDLKFWFLGMFKNLRKRG